MGGGQEKEIRLVSKAEGRGRGAPFVNRPAFVFNSFFFESNLNFAPEKGPGEEGMGKKRSRVNAQNGRGQRVGNEKSLGKM